MYVQVNFDITEDFELTVSGRYDEDDYSTRLFDPATGTTINSLDASGNPVDKLTANDSKFQPKVTLSYNWSENLLTYASYSEGYRFGFFNTGNITAPEETKNYEFGFKSVLLNGRATFNAAGFYIDYSNQQLTSAIGEPPFRITTNIPESDILGFELESAVQVTENLRFSAGIGYLDAEISELNRELDAVPEVTANVALDYVYLTGNDFEIVGRFDWRYQGEFILNGGLFGIDAVDFINLRLGLRKDNWSVTGFVKNVLDEQYATEPGRLAAPFFPTFFIRSFSPPRSAGVEVGYRF